MEGEGGIGGGREDGGRLVEGILVADLTSHRGSTNAGMDWNGMDYWNGLQDSNSQLLFFHTLSNRVSIASHTPMKITAMKMHGKIV